MTSLDALLIVNELATRSRSSEEDGTLVDPAELLNPAASSRFPGFYFDVNGSGTISALDALLVINFISQGVTSPSSDGGFVTGPIPPSLNNPSSQTAIETNRSMSSAANITDLAIESLAVSTPGFFDLLAASKWAFESARPTQQDSLAGTSTQHKDVIAVCRHALTITGESGRFLGRCICTWLALAYRMGRVREICRLRSRSLRPIRIRLHR